MCLGPDYVLQIGRKALTDPLLCPVFGSDDQAEPGVGNLVANSGAAQGQLILPRRTGAPGTQHTLGQENYMGAGERKMTEESDKARG